MREKLKEYRIKKKLTKQEIADQLGITFVQYYRIENGYSSKDSTWAKIQTILNIPDEKMWEVIIEQKGN